MNTAMESAERDRTLSLGGYVIDQKRSTPLGSAEQQRLATLYSQTRDPKIEHRLIEANLRLVIKIAREVDRVYHHPLEDLVQEGTLGLIQAIRKFDPTKGASLGTYAGIWIRAFVMKHVMDNIRIVRAVRTRDQRAAFFRGVIAVAEVSFDTPRTSGATPLQDVLLDPAPTVEEVVGADELARRLRSETARMKARLTRREVTVLDERLLAEEPKPLRIIGRKLSLSGERVRQIEAKLLAAIEEGIELGGVGAAA
jgi:RNA polymerase sigma-32 factor